VERVNIRMDLSLNFCTRATSHKRGVIEMPHGLGRLFLQIRAKTERVDFGGGIWRDSLMGGGNLIEEPSSNRGGGVTWKKRHSTTQWGRKGGFTKRGEGSLGKKERGMSALVE